jgi:hypothetical protein
VRVPPRSGDSDVDAGKEVSGQAESVKCWKGKRTHCIFHLAVGPRRHLSVRELVARGRLQLSVLFVQPSPRNAALDAVHHGFAVSGGDGGDGGGKAAGPLLNIW